MTEAFIEWACDAVHRQGDGADMVPRFIRAFRHAEACVDAMGGYCYPGPELVADIGQLVHPLNTGYFRELPIKIKGKILHPDNFPRQLKTIADAFDDGRICHDEWYYRFQGIHPLYDGNGRTGQIIWYFLKQTPTYTIPPRFNDLAARFG